MLRSISTIGVACLLASCATTGAISSQSPSTATSSVPNVSSAAYTVIAKPAVGGGHGYVYGLACNNGTPVCDYKWDAFLCKAGLPHNADPFGSDTGNVPGYSVMDGRRVRLFICQ